MPDWPTEALRLPAGLLTTELYRRRPNLWALGVAHALLGDFAGYFVLGRGAGSRWWAIELAWYCSSGASAASIDSTPSAS